MMSNRRIKQLNRITQNRHKTKMIQVQMIYIKLSKNKKIIIKQMIIKILHMQKEIQNKKTKMKFRINCRIQMCNKIYRVN